MNTESDTYQAIWNIQLPNGNTVTGIINSKEPLEMDEWMGRIEDAVADAVDVGSYHMAVQIGGIINKLWTVRVKRKAFIYPF
jgi:hypothetical protein